jgi:hypothetical protein
MNMHNATVLKLALPLALAIPAGGHGQDAAPAAVPSVAGSATQVTPGSYWCRGQQAFRVIGDNKTWLYLESCQTPGAAPTWIWCNDNECEKTLIAAAASGHWIGINFNTATTFSQVRLLNR